MLEPPLGGPPEATRSAGGVSLEKHQLLLQEIKAGKRRGNVISADDYEIADISVHRDLAEFEYDIRDNAVFFRPLDGWWPESVRHAGEFRPLKAKAVADSQAQ
jgi:hypothetical protein